jgi:hypothetical protein
MDEKITRFASKLMFFAFVVVICYFFYLAITTTPVSIGEVDSLNYHIPLAKHILSGNIFNTSDITEGLGFYPALGETILSLFMVLRIPLGFYNVVGACFLFFVLKKLGQSILKSEPLSTIFAVSVVLLNSLMRLYVVQVVDVWFLVFYVWSLYLISSKKINYFFLGIALGGVLGIKYSGLFFALALVLVYFRNFTGGLTFKKAFIFLVPLLSLGVFWYVKNYFLTGNPFYPGNFLFFRGDSSFAYQVGFAWNLIGNIYHSPKLIIDFLVSLNSEYFLWFLGYLFIRKLDKFAIISYINLAIFALLLPYWPGIFISNLRLNLPSITAMILSLFLYFKNKSNYLLIYPILSILIVFTQMHFYPKLYAIVIIFLLLYESLNLHNNI